MDDTVSDATGSGAVSGTDWGARGILMGRMGMKAAEGMEKVRLKDANHGRLPSSQAQCGGPLVSCTLLVKLAGTGRRS